jgi:hypothetical protein
MQVQTIVTVARIFLFLALIMCWVINFPNQQISSFIGAHFPWPTAKSWKWNALLVEGALIQLVAAGPVALLLVISFRTWAVRVALALSAIFAFHTLRELPSQINPPYGSVFVVYVGICHALLLIGMTSIIRRRLSRPVGGTVVGN